MNKHVCLAVVLLAAASPAFSQKVTGKVVDEATRQPLQGVTIINLHNKASSVSDLDGNFSLTGKTDTVRVSSTGYVPKECVVTEKNPVISLSPSFANLNEVIVSANREVQKRTEVPVSISVIGKTQINDTKATRLDMLINKVPGVFMADLGNEQHSMAVRQPLGYNNLFLYLEDGIPVRTVGDFNHNALIEINQASLQRIEVIKGPASSLYGSEAVGGALNFITMSPSPFLSGKIQAEGGSRGYKRTDFNISNTYKKTGLYFGGYIADQHQPESAHNNFYKTALTFRADYAFNKDTKLVTVADYIHYKTDQKGGLDSSHFVHEDYTSLYRFTYRKVDAFRFRTTLSKKWNENNHTDVTLFYRNTSVGQDPFYSITDIAASEATGQINTDAFKSFGAVVQHSKKIRSLHAKWTTGISVDYSPATYQAQLIYIHKEPGGVYDRYQPADSVLTDYRANLFNSAVYTQYEYNPVTRLRIVLAARYDRLDYQFDNHLTPGAYTGAPDAVSHFDHFTPKLGFTYDFGNNRGLYVNYSVGFAPPNINDLYRGVKVPTLKPSSYQNYEAGGWLGFCANKGSAEISLYRLDGKNEIVNTRLANGSYQNENAGVTTHEGIEANIKYAPVKDLAFRVGGTVARHRYISYTEQGKNYSGNEMPQSPAYMMNGEITYKPRYLGGFRIGIESQSLGSYFKDPQNTSKYSGFVVFNARMGYTFKGFETWVNWINVANRNYAVTVEKSGYGTSYRPGQLGTVQIGAGWHLNKQ